jgi:eukaryotic-like serine/threonine-protein kinase
VPLVVGTRLGPYELVTLLGHGGMGEVYRARDTRLDRSVAIKIIAPGIAPDAEARRRLLAEARAASLLSHPNICALYDIGSHETTDFLVMELLEGETLAARLQRGALPFASVVRIGVEIAQALDAAHAHGIVHRDLKPGNVMLTRTGAKLLDFGIATIGRPAATEGNGPAASTTGAVTGTPPYMAPEQLDGRDVDSRADVFALGAVLYEMATGFHAVTTAASPPGAERDAAGPSSLRPGIPVAFDRLVLRCLAKDPEERWQSVRDILFQVRAIGERGSSPTVVRWRPPHIAAGIAAAVAVLTLAAAAAIRRPTPVASGTFQIALPAGARLEPPEAVSSLALTRDGSQIAFVAAYDGRNRLWVRPLTSATARPLPGTEDARIPFWSPDGRSLGFFAAGKLLRIDPGGGPPQLICEAAVETAPSWGPDNTILFAQTRGAAQGRSGGLYRVSASGGPITQVTALDQSRGESEHYWPSFLPDGVHFFYIATIAEKGGIGRRHTLFVGSTADAAVTRVADIDSRVSYSATGHVVYGHDGALMARQFDLRSRQFRSDPVSIADRLWYFKPTGLAQYAMSEAGVVAYHGGPSLSELVWLDRTGRRIGTMGASGSYAEVRISRDGRSVAAVVVDSRTGSSNIWIFERESGRSTRFTSEPDGATRPVWSADGEMLFYRSTGANGPPDIYQQRVDGRGSHEIRLALDGVQQPDDASPDGRYLIYSDANRGTIRDLWVLPLSPAVPARPYLRTPAVEYDARVSPDSRWIAFVSSESGKAEVYVAPADNPGAKRRVSIDGGLAPRWRQDGRELVYVDLTDTFMAVEFLGGPVMRAGQTRPLFSAGRLFRGPGGGFGEPYYDLAPDGQTFLVNRLLHDSALEPITVVLNWPALLKQ